MRPKKQEKVEGAPAWVLTFGDMMSLLLTFFILIVSFSEIRQEKQYQQAVQSIKEAFGLQTGMGVPSVMIPPELEDLMRMKVQAAELFNSEAGDSQDKGATGRHTLVTTIRDGLTFTLGGGVAFREGRAELLPEVHNDLLSVANTIRGFRHKVDIRGHTSRAPLPADSPFSNHMDLSYARAKAVADFLCDNGQIEPERIRITAAGSFEPLVVPAYDPLRRARNSRVEIIVNESLVQEFQGENINESNSPLLVDSGQPEGASNAQ